MKSLAFAPVLVLALVAGGCIKSSNDATVGGDGSAKIKMSIGYKKEVIDNIKAMIDAQMGGEDESGGDGPAEGFAKFEASFDDKKIAEQWKKHGLEVAKSSTAEKDGWKSVEIEGSVKNVTEYARKRAATMKEMQDAASEGPMAAMSEMSADRLALPAVPRFYKTDQPNVAKVVLETGDMGSKPEGMPDFEEMSDEEREQVEMGFDQMRAMFGLDDLKIGLRMKLPGKILSVSNAKKEGDDVIVFELLGSNLTVDTMAEMGRTKGQVSATLQFDPTTFKIALEDEPKAESKPAAKKDEKPKKDEEEKKKKDEDEDK
jgi:hypothetical protein